MENQTLKKSDPTFKEIRQILSQVSSKLSQVSSNQINTDKMFKKTDRKIKDLHDLFTGQWGKLMEELVTGDFVRLLKDRNIEVETIARNMEIKGKAEFDIIATNGDCIVVCEVKTTLTMRDVESFLNKLEKLSDWRPEYKKKKVFGAIAFLKSNEGTNIFSEKKGLFVIRAVGSSASIINKKNFKPKSF